MGAVLAAGVVLVGTHLTVWLGRAGSPQEAGSVVTTQVPAGVRTMTPDVQALAAAVHSGLTVVQVNKPGGRVVGNGVVISGAGMVLVPLSVVTGGTAIAVTTSDGAVYAGRVIGTDEATELAVVSIGASASSAFTPLTPAGVDSVVPGSWLSLELVGGVRPGGSVGAVLRLGDLLRAHAGGRGLPAARRRAPQGAGARPGAPRHRAREQRLGARRHRHRPARGEVIEIPGRLAEAVGRQIVEHGRVLHGWLGIVGESSAPGPPSSVVTTSSLLHTLRTPPPGVEILQVVPGTPAASAGLRKGDVIEAVDGLDVTSMQALEDALYVLPPTPTSPSPWRGDPRSPRSKPSCSPPPRAGALRSIEGVSDTPFFGGGDFLRNMLGDLVRMMPSGPGVQWQLANQLAGQIAAGSGPDPNPDPLERIRLDELCAIAELHVAEATGMPVSPGGGSIRLVPASRLEWARRILEVWHPVLDRVVAVLAPDAEEAAGAPGDDLEAAGEEAAEDAEMEALFSQWATAMFPAMAAWRMGSVAGHLAEWALGQYDVPLCAARGDELLVVSGNLASVAKDWGLPPDDLRLWLCVHEMAYHTVLARPAASERLGDLVVEHVQRVRIDPDTLGDLLQEADPNDTSSFARLLGDPSALRPPNAALQQVREELDAVTAAVAGYAEHVTGALAERLIGNTVPIGEAMRRRRVSRAQGERAAEDLFGLRLDQAQVNRGSSFVAGVLERSGEVQLARMWSDPRLLPTPAEIDAPGLWLARLDLPAEE